MARSLVGTYSRLAGLAVEIDGYELERLEQPVSSQFTRVTTVIRLRGGGEEGVGEDVVWDADLQTAFQSAGGALALSGSWTLDSFAARLAELDLFPETPARGEYVGYRRWAFESAALDLGLRQARRSLAEAVGRELQPVRFVVSMSLPEPPTVDPVLRRLERDPQLRFKIDSSSSWTDDVIARLAATQAVDTIDLKGAYGEFYGEPANPELYARVARAFPDAWIEDPDLRRPEALEALEDARDRITWDAPIHSVADIEALPFAPRMLNVKPSRFGGVQTLLDAYDYCAERGIGCYGGGQFELGPGRGQIQYLAALFHPDAPNDVAPSGYNDPSPPDGLPESPLDPAPAPIGFRGQALQAPESAEAS
jgi:L-alanine-DL-glutamate epimerase-like enolase superfamily enzyme